MFAAVDATYGADLAHLVRCAADFSPFVEETSPSTVVISIDGLAHLFGSPREIAGAIARRAADLGLAVNVAIADNPDLAVHAARGFAGVTVMESGRESGLPVALLDPHAEPLQGRAPRQRARSPEDFRRNSGGRCGRSRSGGAFSH